MVGSRARQRNKEIFGLHPRQTEGPSKSSILSADCVPGMFLDMNATVFQSDAPLDKRRIVVRRNGSDVEMVELPWGLRARDGRARAVSVVRSEGRRFPTHRCLVPASEFRHKNFSFSLADGDWFYFAGIWRPAAEDWPEGFAILTIEANPDLAPYQDRQMAVLRRDQRMAWLDGRVPEDEILRPLPEGTFRVKDTSRASDQPALAS
ncbi:putative SOS response-associated peptidase YedK [Rhizobium sp. BK418]|nr:putative SOS response-associated peptidase YedK [Rhizobium sp. BK418]